MEDALAAFDDLVLVDDVLPVLVRGTGHGTYDFDLRAFFACRSARMPVRGVIARRGAFDDYAGEHAALLEAGIALVNTPEEHVRAATLGGFLPRLHDLSPRTVIFDGRPSLDDVEAALGWPVFVKGERQTSRHRRELSIARSRDDLARILQRWDEEPILRWQKVACRELLALRPVGTGDPDKVPPSFELRCFFFRGALVGFGRYWKDERYDCTEAERAAATALATEAARRMDVPFLVVDVAQRTDGRWVVIECNDAQESGFAGVSPFALFSALVERGRMGAAG